MDWRKHEDFFSAERMNRYLFACNNQQDVAIKLYKYNIQASQALYPLLSTFEVSLRNALDRSVSAFFNDKNWLITQRSNFAHHPLMVYKNLRGIQSPDLYFRNKLLKTENQLRSNKKPVTHGKLLAELTFGFWLNFYKPNSMKVLKGAPLNVFINKPSKNLHAIRHHFIALHLLRNKIAHNESICFNQEGKICLNTLAGYENKIVEALGWIGTDLKTWTDKLNFYKLIYNRISTPHHSLPHASSSA